MIEILLFDAVAGTKFAVTDFLIKEYFVRSGVVSN
jgi:hypothetical protein